MRSIIRPQINFALGSILAAFLCAQLLFAAHAQAAQESDAALTAYHQGIAAQSMGEREQAFEKALALYLSQYNQMKKNAQVNGLLCYNIGNCYFNLEQNAQAIVYYQIAKKLLPLNKKISTNLKTALEKRENGVDVENDGMVDTLLFFHYKLSVAQQINALVVSAIITALALFFLMFKGNALIRYLAIFSGLTATSLCISLGVDYYQPNNIGILMRAADVRRGAGQGFAPITSHPLGGGSSVKVISLAAGWYTIQLNDGQQGYLPQKDLKLVTL